MFEGDLVHAGAGYSRANTRVHVYLDVAEVRRPPKSTWIVSQFVALKVRQWYSKIHH